MGRGSDKNDPQGNETTGPRQGQRYSSSHGNASRILQQEQGQSSAGPENARPPGLPSVEELKELNQRIHEDAGFPEFFKLDQPSPLESCLVRACAAYADTPEGVIQTAALLAHGIAQAQAFRDGNRRTAYFVTQAFLQTNGYGYLSPKTTDDHSLARYLNQVVEGQASSSPGPEKFAALFSRRFRRCNLPT